MSKRQANGCAVSITRFSWVLSTPLKLKPKLQSRISAEDDGVIVKGNIDVLVVQKQFWILVIESKSTKFDVMTALPQALAYMLDDSKRDQSTFGLLVNGREFVFVKLMEGTLSEASKAFLIPQAWAWSLRCPASAKIHR